MTPIDRDALQRAYDIARKDPKQRRWIEARLAEGADWEEVAQSCACNCQHDSLHLPPWAMPPLSYYRANNPEAAKLKSYGDPSGAREAVEILNRMLALHLSMYEPSPLDAIGEAEQRATARS